MRHPTIERRRITQAGWLAGVSMIALAAPMIAATPATAVDFDIGELSGSFDTTLTYGLSFRVQDRTTDLVGLANGGSRFSVNGDDGNLNYDTGLISNSLRATHELLLDYNGFGVFSRANYFYDFENANGDRTERTNLSDEAIQRVGKDFNLLDAYVYGGFDVGSVPVDFRIGDQVLSWGESTFIQNGINVINPVDVNAIRIPGSEIRDALLPVTIADVDISLTDNFSVEGFYQLDWEETDIDASGTFFSTNDFASPGGSLVFLGFGAIPDNPALIGVPGGALGTPAFGSVVPRGATREAEDEGQFGLAMRYFAEDLNETEFGAYFINYHSRTPIISAITGEIPQVTGANYAATARYFTEYPEDIQLIGASFNTPIGNTSLQGEVSYRIDQPLQVDDVELLIASLTPFLSDSSGGALDPLLLGNQIVADVGSIPGTTQELSGFREFDVIQAQATATHAFGPISSVGVDQWIVVGEVGFTSVPDLPDKNTLLFEGPNTPLPGSAGTQAILGAIGVAVPTQTDGFADDFSWGYRVRARFDFLNAVGPVNLFPVFGFSHDVGGTTPQPLGNFVEDRASVSIGLNATYLEQWSAGIQYTNFFAIGEDKFNSIRDRDIVTLNVKYSF